MRAIIKSRKLSMRATRSGLLSASRVTFACAALLTTTAALAGGPVVTTLVSLPPQNIGLDGPAGTLAQGIDGKLYGVASSGSGPETAGGAFSVSLDGTYTDISDFSLNITGGNPQTGVMRGSDGNFYGTLLRASQGNNGALFSFTPAGQFTELHIFASTNTAINADGTEPTGNLVQGPDGTFYGATFGGGANGGGVIFSLTADGVYNLLHVFPSFGADDAATQGVQPTGGLIFGADGNLYGTTASGGANNAGVLFRITPSGTFTSLLSFPAIPPGASCRDFLPESWGALTLGPDGNFYGARCADAQGSGSIFKFDATADALTILHTFGPAPQNVSMPANTDGVTPKSSLVLGADGNFYGTTLSGGQYNYGTVFVISSSGQFKTLYSFGGVSFDAISPSPLILASDGNFYGTSGSGGVNGTGSVFKVKNFPLGDLVLSNPSTGTLDVRQMSRLGERQIMENAALGYYPVAVADFNGDGIPDILWTSAKHDLYLWLGASGGHTGFVAKYVGTYPAGWTVAAAGDIDGDGKADIYWINSATHQFGYWLMNGATATTIYSTSYTAGYYPIATGDFNGDGKLDVLWSSAKNDLYLWTSSVSASAKTEGFISTYAGTFPAGWKVVGTGDLNGDGKSDIVWMSTDGTQWGYWLMNGAQRLASNISPVPAAFVGYSIAAVGDYDADGASDLVWSNGANLSLWSNTSTCSGGGTCTFTPVAGAFSPQTAGTTIFNSVP